MTRDGEIDEGDVRAAAGVAQGPGAGGAGKRHQCAGGRIAHPAGRAGTADQWPGAERPQKAKSGSGDGTPAEPPVAATSDPGSQGYRCNAGAGLFARL